VLYHDEETETFWSQMTGEAVVGPLTGQRLAWIPSEVATWKDWRARHPDTTVLEAPLDDARYEATDRYYTEYRNKKRPQFPIGPVQPRADYAPMADVTIARIGGKPRCYPHAELAEGETRDGDLRVVRRGRSVRLFEARDGGEEVPTILAYWFAWEAFFGARGTVYRKPR